MTTLDQEAIPPSNHAPLIADRKEREPVASRFEPRSSISPHQVPPSQLGIDDITIASRFPELTELLPGFLPADAVRGRPDRYWTTRANGALYITHTPATQIVTARISVPRWVRDADCNYPLAPIQSVENLRPKELARELAAALSVRVSIMGPDLERRFPVRRWPVLRVAYACDLHVLDPIVTLAGCRALRRRHQGRVQTFGLPTTTLQWASKHLRVQMYAKSLELESRLRTASEDERVALQQLARQAEHVLRFEITLLGVRAIRDLFQMTDGRLPPLQVMCDPLVARWALTRQTDRLRVRESDDAPSTASLAERSRQVRARLEQESRVPSGRLLRTKRLSRARVHRLAVVYFLGCGHRPSEIAKFLDLSAAAVSEALRDLDALGLSPDGSAAGNLGDGVRELLDQLEPHLLDGMPDLSHWAPPQIPRVDVPWADVDDNDPDAAMCAMDADEEAQLRAALLP